MILAYLNDIKADHYQSRASWLKGVKVVTDRPVRTEVDWLRCTNTKLKDFHDFMHKFTPLLRGHGFNFVEMERGMGNYSKAYQIQFNERVCGAICADPTEGSSNIGGMLDLTGAGCKVLQSRWDLWCYLVTGLMEYGFNIKRLDVAADFKGALWMQYKVNILHMNDAVQAGMFSTGKCGPGPAISLLGDFSKVLSQRMGADDYVPMVHAPSGCTINVGKRTSCSSWCIYEKGKQLAGKNPDLCDTSMFDWVRVERRFSQGSGRSKKVIPFEFALYPDEAIVYQCQGFAKFLADWDDFRADNGFEVVSSKPSDVVLDRASMVAGVNFKRSAIHASQHAARFIRSLVMLNIDPMDWVKRAMHEKPVKGFCADYLQDFSLDSFLPKSEVCL